MFTRDVLGLAEARTIVETVIAEASKEPEKPIGVVVVDDRGDPIFLARMDGGFPLFTEMSLHKAYTAARFRRDSLEFGDRQKQANKTITGFGDSMITDQAGGLSIKKKDGTSLGAVGVSGRSTEENIRLGQAGLKTLNV